MEIRRKGTAEMKMAQKPEEHPGEGKETPPWPPWTQVHTFARHRSDPILDWGKLWHHPPALVGTSYWNNLFFISLGDGSTWACLCSVDAASLSFTDVFPCNAFLLCPCLDSFCLCCSSHRVKKLRVGFDYLITMVTRMTLMPICTQ